MNGQHRGDGHPYGGDEPTPEPSGQESFRPRHGSPWPDAERPAPERSYGPGQEPPGAPYDGSGRPPGYPEGGPYRGEPYGGDPYAGGPRGPEPQAPYPPQDFGRGEPPAGRPEQDTAAPTSAFQAFMAGEDRGPRDTGDRGYREPPGPGFRPEPSDPGFRPEPPDPGFRAEPPDSGFRPEHPDPGFRPEPPDSGFRAGPPGPPGPPGPGPGPGPDPRGAGPYPPADPYTGGPPSTPQYGDAPQYGDLPPDFGRGEPRNAPPSPDEGRFSAGALGGGRFSADALGGGPRPDAPGPPGDVRGPAPQDGPPRHPSEDPTDRYQRRPEWESKPYAPPNAATEAMPSVESGDRRVASGNPDTGMPRRVAGNGPDPRAGAPSDFLRGDPQAEHGPDAAAPTSAFQAFMAGQDQAVAGDRGFREQERGRDADERGYGDFDRDRDFEDRGRRGYDRGRDDEPAGYRSYGRGRDDAYDDEPSSAPLWSLILSIVGIVALPLVGLGVIASVAAVVLARGAHRDGHRSGLAGAGLFLGWIGVGLFAVGIIGGLLYLLL